MVDVTWGNTTIGAAYNHLVDHVKLGEPCSDGAMLYQKTTDNLWYNAINTSTGAVQATRMALGAGISGSYVAAAKAGAVVTATGSSVVPYFVSSTAGGVEPLGAMTTNDYICLAGHGTTGGILLTFTYLLGEQVA